MTPPGEVRRGTRSALIALLVSAWTLGCGEDAPHVRDSVPPPKDAAPEPDAGKPYDGTCGDVTCPPPGPLRTPGCCTRPGTGQPGDQLENVGRAENLCGTDIGAIAPSLAGICLQLSQPGEVNSQCPAQMALAGGAPRPGCCTDEGFCGTLDEYVPLGCFYAPGLKGGRCEPGPRSDGGTGGEPEGGASGEEPDAGTGAVDAST